MNGFVPTVTKVKKEGDMAVFETLDPNPESDLVSTDLQSPGCSLERRANVELTDEQLEQLDLQT